MSETVLRGPRARPRGEKRPGPGRPDGDRRRLDDRSGIFALPSQMAGSAAPGPLLIGWVITGVGMLTLAFVFQTLATRKPDVDGGVYGYARAGFGNYIGFTSAFGYWVSAWVGNVAYLVLLFSTLGYFFPAFEGGATVPAIIGASSCCGSCTP